MAICFICGGTCLLFKNAAGTPLNYFYLNKKLWVWCPTCGKKAILSIIAMLNDKDSNISEAAKTGMFKMAKDQSVKFEGENATI